MYQLQDELEHNRDDYEPCFHEIGRNVMEAWKSVSTTTKPKPGFRPKPRPDQRVPIHADGSERSATIAEVSRVVYEMLTVVRSDG